MVCVLTLFPGIISYFLMKTPIARNYSELNLFLVCALAIVGYDIATNHHSMAFYFLVPSAGVLAFLLEVAIVHGLRFFQSSVRAMYHQIGKSIITLIIFPFLEEYIYRYFLYDLLMRSEGSSALFIIASTVFFVGSHLYSQREKALTKIPLGIALAGFYVCFQNIFVCLSIHLSFNLCVYFYNQTSKGAKYNY